MPAPQPIRFVNPLNAGIAATVGLLSGVEKRRQEKLTRSQALADVAAERNFILERDRNEQANKLQIANANRETALANQGKGSLSPETRDFLLNAEVPTEPVRNPQHLASIDFFQTDSLDPEDVVGVGPSEENRGPLFVPGPTITAREVLHRVRPDIPPEIFNDRRLSGSLAGVLNIAKTVFRGELSKADGDRLIDGLIAGEPPKEVMRRFSELRTLRRDVNNAKTLAKIAGVPIGLAIGPDAIPNVVKAFSAKVRNEQERDQSQLDRISTELRAIQRLVADFDIEIGKKSAIGMPVEDLLRARESFILRRTRLLDEARKVRTRGQEVSVRGSSDPVAQTNIGVSDQIRAIESQLIRNTPSP